MTIRTTLITTGLIAASLSSILASGAAHAELQGRDMDGDALTFEAYYDTDLDITWLADANYAQTSGYDADGKMDWDTANTWAADLSFTDGVNVYDNWRLPTVVDPSSLGCIFAYTGTDCGYNVVTANSEMAYLFYVELGNKSYYNTAGVGPQAGWGLTNTGPFTDLQADYYWSGTELASNTSFAWLFFFYNGSQLPYTEVNGFYALAVSPGDVGAVPEADTWAMLLAGLGLVGAATRRRRG